MPPAWEVEDLAREARERRQNRLTWLIAFGIVPVLTVVGLILSGELRLDRSLRIGEGQDLIEQLAKQQLAHRERTGRWADRFDALSMPAPRSFTCLLSATERLLPTADDAVVVDANELPSLIDELELGVTCDEGAACDYLAACAARWEWNGLMTVWFVSSRGLGDGTRRPNVPFSPGVMP